MRTGTKSNNNNNQNNQNNNNDDDNDDDDDDDECKNVDVVPVAVGALGGVVLLRNLDDGLKNWGLG